MWSASHTARTRSGSRRVIRSVQSDLRIDDLGEEVARGLGERAVYRHLDIADEGSWSDVVAQTVADHGRVDVLVNNAAVYADTPLTDLDTDVVRRIIDTNLLGTILGMKVIVPAMREHGGSIVNVSSVSGMQGQPGGLAYSASKWGIRGASRSAAGDLARLGIRVNSVHPGVIDTDMAGPSIIGESANSGDDPDGPGRAGE
jgi:3alpha(or 20beta)-hydroxysteroid dehydrogenase